MHTEIFLWLGTEAFRADIVNIFEEDGLIDEYDEYLRDAALKNTEMWQYDRGYTGDVAAIKEWFETRIDVLDSYFENPKVLLSKSKKYTVNNIFPAITFILILLKNHATKSKECMIKE